MPAVQSPSDMQSQAWSGRTRTSLLIPILMTLLLAGVGLGGFLVWAATAPIAGSVMASGHIAANGENQTIQHLEGGMVQAIHVREGDSIEAGQPLITLDATLVQANLNRARNSVATLRIDAALLQAEMFDQDNVVLPPEIERARLNASIGEFLDAKIAEFTLRKQRFRNEISILAQRLAGLDEEMAGLKAQREAILKQIPLVQEELTDVDYLFKQGLARKDKWLALRRTEADLEGRAEALTASIGKAKQLNAELLQQMEKLWHDRRTDASGKMSDTRNRIADTLEQIVSYENVLSRVVVAAPASGTVVRLNVNTVGAVISPGQAVAELLPRGADLVIEAKLQLTDVDAVQVGTRGERSPDRAQSAHHPGARLARHVHLGGSAHRPGEPAAILSHQIDARPAAVAAVAPTIADAGNAGRSFYPDLRTIDAALSVPPDRREPCKGDARGMKSGFRAR